LSPTSRVVWRSFGVTFAVEAAPALLRRAVARLPPGARVDGVEPGHVYRIARVGGALRLWRDGRVIHRALPPAAALDALASAAQLLVACDAPDLLFVHAGVVSVGGRALLLPGRSFAGKSTLTAALVAAGATYYSDEYALLDGRGRVHAFPRPLALRRQRGRRRVAPPPGPRPPLPVGKILFVRHRAGAALRLRPLPPGRCLLALLKHTVAARRRTSFALPILARVATAAPAWYGIRGEAAELAAQLINAEATRARRPPPARRRRRAGRL